MSQPTPAGFAVRFSRTPRAISALVILLVVCATLLVPAVAFAATAPAFDSTFVISDDVFRASGAMSVADIQAFLEARKGVLDITQAPRHADGTMQPVSQLVWEVSQEFNVNPKVMLVMLQKEQSLLEATAPSQNALDWAFGFGCYDGSTPDTRDPKYKGLGNQIWYSARALDSYAETTWTPGLKRTICTNCIGSPTIPATYDTGFVAKNLATYKLYVYTPHSHGPTPDIHGGNYLFWTTYWKYFDEGPLANPALRPVYRFYNKVNGSHFYTASEAERLAVIRQWSATYNFEGPAYSINTSNTANVVPLHRFYNVKNGSHFYTASYDEANSVIANLSATYRYEGPVYNVSMTVAGGTPVYRFYNKRNGSHFYTVSLDEANATILNYSSTYNFEGVAYYIGN